MTVDAEAGHEEARREAEPSVGPSAAPPDVPSPVGGPEDAVRFARSVFESASTPPRWPMYVRNVKQILKSADPAFDERRFGINGALELVRACQRDGVLRLERDRRGVLRVFPGAALQRQPAEAEPAADSSGASEEAMAAGPPAVGPDTAMPSGGRHVPEPALPGAAVIEGEIVSAEVEPVPEPASAEAEPKPKRRRRASAQGEKKPRPRKTDPARAPGSTPRRGRQAAKSE